MLANGQNPPSTNSMRQVRYKQLNKLSESEKKVLSNLKTNDWYSETRARAITLNKELGTNYIAGYVESLRDVPFFEMILLRKEQLDCIRMIKK